MAGENLRVRGLRPLLKALRDVENDLPDEVKQINRDMAGPVAATARGLAPRRSGDLAGSVREGATRRSGTVKAGKAGVPYAGPIHFGWPRRHISPQPFLWDALGANLPRIEREYPAKLAELVDRVFPSGTGGE